MSAKHCLLLWKNLHGKLVFYWILIRLTTQDSVINWLLFLVRKYLPNSNFEFSFSFRFHHPLGPDIWNFDLTQFPKRFGQIHPSWA